MMTFLARAMQNPTFLHQLVHQKERMEIEEEMARKRRREIDQGPGLVYRGESSGTAKNEPYGFRVSELEALALEMQGFGKTRRKPEEGPKELKQNTTVEKELDEGFLEELLNERLVGEFNTPASQ